MNGPQTAFPGKNSSPGGIQLPNIQYHFVVLFVILTLVLRLLPLHQTNHTALLLL